MQVNNKKVVTLYGYWTTQFGWGKMTLLRKGFKKIKFKPEGKPYNIIIDKNLNETL